MITSLVFRVRPLSWFFRKNWYAIRKGKYPMSTERYHLVDIGAVTIGWRMK